jgi:ABC-2 type transport system ATP-binding protein
VRLSIRDFSKSYGETLAVDALTLDVEAGEIVGLLGPNGAGKTTTLKGVVGLLEPDRGTIAVDGIDRLANPREAKRRIGYVPDRPWLPPRLTGREYLEFVAGLFEVPAAVARPRIDLHLARFRIADAADRLVESWSHGMKQKLALGNLFVHDPPLFVVDEPMVGLDAAAQALVRRILREEAAAGKGILFTTHTLVVAEAICDRVVILDRARVVAEGSPAEIASAAGRSGHPLEELFLELTSAGEPEP